MRSPHRQLSRGLGSFQEVELHHDATGRPEVRPCLAGAARDVRPTVSVVISRRGAQEDITVGAPRRGCVGRKGLEMACLAVAH